MTVQERIRIERARLARLSTLAVVAVALATLAVLLAAGVLILGSSRWIALPAATPFVVWGVALCAAAAISLLALRRVRRDTSVATLASEIERERALRRGSLLGVLELGDSSPLARAAERRLAGTLGETGEPLSTGLRKRTARRGLAGFTALGTGALLLAGFGGRSPDGLQALVHPMQAARGTLLPEIELLDAPASVLRGEELTVAVRASGRRTIRLASRTTGAAWQYRTLPVGDDGLARMHFETVDADLLLSASDGRSTSDTAIVTASTVSATRTLRWAKLDRASLRRIMISADRSS